MKHKKILRYVTLSLLLAIAIVLNYLESFIPSIGIPGVKLGLANIVILICLYKYKVYEALMVDLLRVLLANLLKGTFLSIAFYMSLSGAMLSFLVMFLFRYIKTLKPLVISVIGAIFHAVGQIVVALIIMQTSGILLYLPFIMLASIITGILNGIVCERIIATNLFEILEENKQDE
ncbi:MAG: Gx transporter family protein [Bacilli bacterium]|nr:Gx transporter family protein [Bacilli bacterium]